MGYRSTLPHSIKREIILQVHRHPGRRARKIAAALNLDLKRVNQFLHYEGKQYYGLRQVNYDWYPPNAPITAPIPPAGPITSGPKSICRALSELPRSEATLKIRTLDLNIVELAFADDDFPLLDDQLKAELSIRRAELMAIQTPEKASIQGSNIWLLIFGLSIALLTSFVISNNRQDNGRQSPNPSLSQ